jgi:hypothetical protein
MTATCAIRTTDFTRSADNVTSVFDFIARTVYIGPLEELGLGFIPVMVIWVWQIFDLIKIVEKRSASNNNHDVIDIESKA